MSGNSIALVGTPQQVAERIGSPSQITDQLIEWVENEAADGFNLMPPYFPGGFTDFIDLVIPELQKRGVFRTEYEGTTLRENLGLKQVPSRYTLQQV